MLNRITFLQNSRKKGEALNLLLNACSKKKKINFLGRYCWLDRADTAVESGSGIERKSESLLLAVLLQTE